MERPSPGQVSPKPEARVYDNYSQVLATSWPLTVLPPNPTTPWPNFNKRLELGGLGSNGGSGMRGPGDISWSWGHSSLPPPSPASSPFFSLGCVLPTPLAPQTPPQSTPMGPRLRRGGSGTSHHGNQGSRQFWGTCGVACAAVREDHKLSSLKITERCGPPVLRATPRNQCRPGKSPSLCPKHWQLSECTRQHCPPSLCCLGVSMSSPSACLLQGHLGSVGPTLTTQEKPSLPHLQSPLFHLSGPKFFSVYAD